MTVNDPYFPLVLARKWHGKEVAPGLIRPIPRTLAPLIMPSPVD